MCVCLLVGLVACLCVCSFVNCFWLFDWLFVCWCVRLFDVFGDVLVCCFRVLLFCCLFVCVLVCFLFVCLGVCLFV